MRHAHRAQRIHDGIGQRRQRTGAAGFAHALGAQRIQFGRYRVVEHLEACHHAGARHGVIHEAAGEQLPGFPVINSVFAEDLAGALGQPALHLAFHQRVGDDIADVVHGDIGDDLRHPGFGVDFHFGDMCAVREGHAPLAGAHGVQRMRFAALVLFGQVEQADPAVGAFDGIFAMVELDVLNRGFQFLCSQFAAFFDHFLCAEQVRTAEAHHGARAAGAAAGDAHTGLAGAQLDDFHGHAEHAGHHLREAGLMPLPV